MVEAYKKSTTFQERFLNILAKNLKKSKDEQTNQIVKTTTTATNNLLDYKKSIPKQNLSGKDGLAAR